MSHYLIGIDLGTTNSALASVSLETQGTPLPKPFPVPQLVGPGEVGERALLPSFLYLPGEHDLPPGACALPWDPQRNFLVGEFARAQGAKVPGRLVSSAKSWLCHAGVDRTAPLLPFSAPPEVTKVSPVEASVRILRHLAEAWNQTVAKKRPDARLEEQEIVLTVPASFDDVARSLTAEAARHAGFKHLTLLEEPQAAFYAWLVESARGSHSLQGLEPGMTCLVVDVGGGTSDFSLIEAVAEEGRLGFMRKAVGDHLLLGGDNMDLALAHHVERKLEGTKLDAARFSALTQASRAAKEALLAPNPPAQFPVTIVGRGRSVIGGSLSTHLTPEDARRIIFDGFFPEVSFDTDPERGQRSGLHDLGLPFVADPAITKHLAQFLRQHGVTRDHPPAALLFNGGVFQPQSLRDRLISVLKQWFDQPGKPWNPIILLTSSLDLAVAIGAAHYSWLRHTGGQRISGGLARSYYLGVQDAAGKVQQLCLVPQSMEEGQSIELKEPVLELALGQPVQFPLFTSTLRPKDQPGQRPAVRKEELLPLAPLQTVLRGGKRSGTKTVPVTLAAKLTEIGTLEVSLVGEGHDNRWRLEFNTRAMVEVDDEPAAASEAVADIWPEEKVQAALTVLRAGFASKNETAAEELPKKLEDALEAGRNSWPTTLCRRLAEALLELADQRYLSPAHLKRWLHLTGFTLRPGWGEAKDRFRVEQLWKLLASPLRQQAGSGTLTVVRGDVTAGADTWILWRRVAGGLSTSHQLALFDRLRPLLIGNKPSAVKPSSNELTEMWRTAASLERLDAKVKEQLGDALLRTLKKPPVPPYTFWALARLGGRVLLYGPLNHVVHHQVVEKWLEPLLAFTPGTTNDRNTWLFCLANLCRKTGHRALDVIDDSRSRVLEVFERENASPRLRKLVAEGGPLEGAEAKQLLGDELPLGLRLAE